MKHSPKILKTICFLSLAAVSGCNPWTPKAMLIDIAAAHGELLDRLDHVIYAQAGVKIRNYDGLPGEWSGDLEIPSDGEEWDIDGSIDMTASVTWSTNDLWETRWLWDIDIAFDPWVVDDHDPSGSGDWTATSTLSWDTYCIFSNYEGKAVIDHGDPVEIT